MSEPARPPRFPSPLTWCFDEIAEIEPVRAKKLESAGTPGDLLNAISATLGNAFTYGSARLGREHAKERPVDSRAVIQFPVGADLFDWFINARTGYRAHFRASADCGLSFNSQIIEAVALECSLILADSVIGHKIVGDFEDAGEVEIPKSFLLTSLVPSLAKVWLCTKRLGRHDVEDLPIGVTGPRLRLGDDVFWWAPYRADEDAWLEIKGAFVDVAGFTYQPKSPLDRAKMLHDRGTA